MIIQNRVPAVGEAAPLINTHLHPTHTSLILAEFLPWVTLAEDLDFGDLALALRKADPMRWRRQAIASMTKANENSENSGSGENSGDHQTTVTPEGQGRDECTPEEEEAAVAAAAAATASCLPFSCWSSRSPSTAKTIKVVPAADLTASEPFRSKVCLGASARVWQVPRKTLHILRSSVHPLVSLSLPLPSSPSFPLTPAGCFASLRVRVHICANFHSHVLEINLWLHIHRWLISRSSTAGFRPQCLPCSPITSTGMFEQSTCDTALLHKGTAGYSRRWQCFR